MPGTHEPLTDALLDPATYAGDLHGALAALRAAAPLAWNATKGFWAVPGHADVSEISSDPSRASARPRGSSSTRSASPTTARPR